MARWLIGLGAPLWDVDQFDRSGAEALVSAERLIVGEHEGRVVSCMTIDDRDEVHWPDEPPASAFYLHKIARRRLNAGSGWGRRMVGWAAHYARAKGYPALRLDCDPRPELMRLYEGLGSRRVDQDPIAIGAFLAVRYERLPAS